MKKHTSVLSSVLVLLLSAIQCDASIATINFDSGSQTLFNSNHSSLLTGGSPTLDGDGAVLQLGYFSGATGLQPFGAAGNGTWIALTGEGGANSKFSTGTGIVTNDIGAPSIKTSVGDRKSVV